MFTPYSLPDAFDPAECDRIIALASAAPLDDAGLVRNTSDHNIRRADLAWLDEREGAEWVMDRIIQIVARANREAFDFALTEFAESAQVARYGAEREGHFDWHSDIGMGAVAARRKLTMVVQLSEQDAYSGGVLELMPDANIHAAGTGRGTATVFPSFVLHRVTPVTAGERWSLTIWSHGPAFR
ncbi:2OG-Fe(II) oxygenase [Defluviimonas aestuarii]|uniref:prolyl hydroxylase family protein n=1 Tax=Albidovulum aestuarii TaxID=1130726 RepID=UPI00249C429A|nr:2OG-Fe(II) oxygenase [Defluviimonas aestuarii]MDI3335985.1 2OG-Fe(II) oxygenase [Defluviimonas aestuarii]